MLLITIDEMLSSKYSDMIPLKCDGCQQDFQRIQKQVKSDYKLKCHLKHFCSSKCQGILKKKDYVNLTCHLCKAHFSLIPSEFEKRSKKTSKLCCSQQCANKINIHRSEETRKKVSETLKRKYAEGIIIHPRPLKNKAPYICSFCSKEFISKKKRSTCSKECYKNLLPSIGRKGGRVTSSLEFHKRNRSSNEKMFFTKIKEIYPDAIANKRLFDGWDADIIIPSQKLAIHWNGVWHYKSVMGNELLERVQQKDKLRYEAIEKHGYKNYIIQDLGPMNEEKVTKEYVDFLQNVKEQLDM